MTQGRDSEEGSVTRAEFDELLEPLKHIQVPPYPGEEAFVCDGALYGFIALLASTSFSYEWHTIAPKGWEPVADWLGLISCGIQLCAVKGRLPANPPAINPTASPSIDPATTTTAPTVDPATSAPVPSAIDPAGLGLGRNCQPCARKYNCCDRGARPLAHAL